MVEREIEIMKRALVLLVIGGAAMAQISPNLSVSKGSVSSRVASGPDLFCNHSVKGREG